MLCCVHGCGKWAQGKSNSRKSVRVSLRQADDDLALDAIGRRVAGVSVAAETRYILCDKHHGAYRTAIEQAARQRKRDGRQAAQGEIQLPCAIGI